MGPFSFARTNSRAPAGREWSAAPTNGDSVTRRELEDDNRHLKDLPIVQSLAGRLVFAGRAAASVIGPDPAPSIPAHPGEAPSRASPAGGESWMREALRQSCRSP